MVNDQAGGTQPHTKTSTAQHEAAGLADSAAGAGQHVGEVAKDEASKVASEVGHQAKDLFHQVTSEAREQAGTQQQKVAEGLHSVSRELSSMADGSEERGMATDLVSQAAGRVGDVADWLEARDPGSLLNEVKDFARRRPGVFIAVAAGAGLLAGRLTRAITSDSHSETSGTRPPAGLNTPPSGGGAPPTYDDALSTPIHDDTSAGLRGFASGAAVAPSDGTAPYDDSIYDELDTDPTRARGQGGERL